MSAVIQIPGGTFDPQLHEYRDENGVVVPSVTQIGDSLGFVDLDNIPGDTLEEKQHLGDAVHFATHAIDTGMELDWTTVHKRAGNYIAAWENAKEELGLEILESEVSGICEVNGMKFSYTRDRIVNMGKFPFPFVVEIKCTYQEEPFWKYQTAGYEISARKPGVAAYGRLAVQLKPDGTFKAYPYENPRDKDRFMYMLAVVHTKIEEGIKWQRTRV